MTVGDSSKHKWLMMEWNGTALVPHSRYDEELLRDRFRRGETVLASFKQERYLPRQRLYWVTLREVVKNTEMFSTENALHKALLMACGVVDMVIDVDGDIQYVPSSTALDAMEEDEFQRYFDQAMVVISTKVIPGLDIKQMLKEARQRSRYKEK